MRPAECYRFREGALEHIKRTRNLVSDSQLAELLVVSLDELAQLRTGRPVTARYALRVMAIQGDPTEGLFEKITPAELAA